MDRHVFVISMFSLTILAAAFFLTPVLAGREMSIPPTKAFSRIITDNGTLEATEWNDYIDMRSTDNVKVNMTGHNLYIWGINSTGDTAITTQGSLSCIKTGNTYNCKISPLSCPILQGVKGVDASGNLFCGVI